MSCTEAGRTETLMAQHQGVRGVIREAGQEASQREHGAPPERRPREARCPPSFSPESRSAGHASGPGTGGTSSRGPWRCPLTFLQQILGSSQPPSRTSWKSVPKCLSSRTFLDIVLLATVQVAHRKDSCTYIPDESEEEQSEVRVLFWFRVDLMRLQLEFRQTSFHVGNGFA